MTTSTEVSIKPRPSTYTKTIVFGLDFLQNPYIVILVPPNRSEYYTNDRIFSIQLRTT